MPQGGGKQECNIASMIRRPLEFTHVILQTFCGEDEVSYGGSFMPVFCALQDTKTHSEVQAVY